MTEETYFEHYSVLNKEVVSFFTENNSGQELLFADLTFGAGGHSKALSQASDKNYVISVDQDSDAIRNGQKILQEFPNIELNQMNFEEFPKFVQEKRVEVLNKFGGFRGIVLDLGVSSHHFDSMERGFSFKGDAPLDMRMSQNESIQTAADLVNTMDEQNLADLIFKYGEERLSRRIAKEIVSKRHEKEIKTTKELENIIFHCYPKQKRHGGIHPATRTFQALRIAVNDELGVLERVIPQLIPLLVKGGQLAIISFHSLEDRIVKHSFKKIYNENKESVKILTKKPIIPGNLEINENSRSRSAKLRVIEKIS